jgi:mRNA interferase RelE/StbE
MRLRFSARFTKSYGTAPTHIQRAFDKQSLHLLANLRHPSLRAKKYDEARDLWQARVTRDWRFYFTIEEDAYYLYDITSHPK